MAFFARDVSGCVDPELPREQMIEEYLLSLPDRQPEPEPVLEPEPVPTPVGAETTSVLAPETRKLSLIEIICRRKRK